MAAHPIVSEDAVIGTVVVEQNINDILRFQRSALEQVIWCRCSACSPYSSPCWHLPAAWHGESATLRREASAAIDSYGRLRTSELTNEMEAGDEIGDLARSVSNMLSKLHRHNTFSGEHAAHAAARDQQSAEHLEHVAAEPRRRVSGREESKYLESAKRGVHRIGSIVQNLADAANLEDALEAEELELIDSRPAAAELCRELQSGAQAAATSTIAARDDRPVAIGVGLSHRAVAGQDRRQCGGLSSCRQLRYACSWTVSATQLQLTVANRGPMLHSDVEKSVFDSMVSHRGPAERLHFGLGLYVVRIIAEYHGGFVRAMNLADGSGCAVMVQLPLAAEGRTHATRGGQPISSERVSAG